MNEPTEPTNQNVTPVPMSAGEPNPAALVLIAGELMDKFSNVIAEPERIRVNGEIKKAEIEAGTAKHSMNLLFGVIGALLGLVFLFAFQGKDASALDISKMIIALIGGFAIGRTTKK